MIRKSKKFLFYIAATAISLFAVYIVSTAIVDAPHPDYLPKVRARMAAEKQDQKLGQSSPKPIPDSELDDSCLKVKTEDLVECHRFINDIKNHQK